MYLAGVNTTEDQSPFDELLDEFAGAFHVWLPFVTWTNTLLRLEMKYTGQQMSHLLYYNLGGDFRAYPEWSDCDYSAYETKAAYSDCPKDIYKLRLNEMITYPIYAAPYEESDASADDWLAMCWVSNKPYAMVEAFGGSVSAEHGIGLLKRDHLHYSRSPAELAMMRADQRGPRSSRHLQPRQSLAILLTLS